MNDDLGNFFMIVLSVTGKNNWRKYNPKKKKVQNIP